MRAAIERLAGVLLTGLGGLLLAALVLSLISAVGRYAAGYSIHGAGEVQAFALVWITLLGAAIAVWKGEHLRMDLLVRQLPPRLARWIAHLDALVIAAVCGFFAWHSLRYTLAILHLGQRSEDAGIPMWWAHAALAAGLVLCSVLALLRPVRAAAEKEHAA
jgi:TRAP-type C4-dicarboxylate transport system permease small subunit